MNSKMQAEVLKMLQIYCKSQFPEYQNEIAAYYNKLDQMLETEIFETGSILIDIKASNKFKLHALTNWSAESFPLPLSIFEFLGWFDDILVSGVEKMKKPDPKIFELIVERNQADISSSFF